MVQVSNGDTRLAQSLLHARFVRRSMGFGAAAALLGAAIGTSAQALTGSLGDRLTFKVGQALEARIPRAGVTGEKAITGVIALGGQKARAIAALELSAKLGAVPVILSGPGAEEVRAADAWLATTGEPIEVVVDERARTTYENAQFSADLARHRPEVGCWIVVTSALHMPRAIAAFRATGLDVLAWPVIESDRVSTPTSRQVWHEVAGLVGYLVTGRTRDLLPACDDGVCMAFDRGTNSRAAHKTSACSAPNDGASSANAPKPYNVPG
ncbi:MAG: YdcF family protein [Hyphomicrobiaceae bacterium]